MGLGINIIPGLKNEINIMLELNEKNILEFKNELIL